MIVQEKKQVEILQDKCTCDICGKTSETMDGSVTWYRVTHWHHGCVNNSCTSIQIFEVCSPACYLSLLQNLVNKNF